MRHYSNWRNGGLIVAAVAFSVASQLFVIPATQAQSTCQPASVSVTIRNDDGIFIPGINFEIYTQTLDVDNKPKPKTKIAGGKIDPTVGKTTVNFAPQGEFYVIKVWDKNPSVGEHWFYNELSGLSCGSAVERSIRVSGIRFTLRDSQQVLRTNAQFKLYAQKNDVDGKAIKGALVGTYDTGTRGEVIAYVSDRSRSLDGAGTGLYVFEATGKQGGVYTQYGISVVSETTTDVNFRFSDMLFTVKNSQGAPYPANTAVEVYKQSKDIDGERILGEKVRNVVTNDKGVAIFENPAGMYAARIKGSDGLYKNFWDLQIFDQQRTTAELATDAEFTSNAGACSTKSALTIRALNADNEYIPGLSYELYVQTTDTKGVPMPGAKVVSGKIGTDGQGEVLFNPDSAKTYVLKMYDKNAGVGDFWYYDGITFVCGVNKEITKTLSSIKVIFRDAQGNLLTKVPFSIYTQKTTIDGKPLAERKDLVASLTTSAEGFAEVYLAPDHPFSSSKRGTYMMTAKRGAHEYVNYSIKMTEGVRTVIEYSFSDLAVTVQDAANTPLEKKTVTLHAQRTDAQGSRVRDAKVIASATTASNGFASMEVPGGTYAVVVKDSANKEIVFWDVRVENNQRNEKVLTTSLVRVTPKTAGGGLMPEKTPVTVYSMDRNISTGEYYRKTKITSGTTGADGTVAFVLAQGAYLFAVTSDKKEYGDAQYIRDGRLFNIEVSALPEYAVSSNTLFTIDDGIQQSALNSAAGANRLKGYIFLQVEEHGEAWYVDIRSGKRYYLKDGPTAYQAMRRLSYGISNKDLEKIPVGFDDRFSDTDTDGDKLPDRMEGAFGTDANKADSDGDGYADGDEVRAGYSPSGPAKLPLNSGFAKTQLGKILLQVEAHGEAWYVNPRDGKRYYMSDGDAAYKIMRYLGQGITNRDLTKIKSDVLK